MAVESGVYPDSPQQWRTSFRRGGGKLPEPRRSWTSHPSEEPSQHRHSLHRIIHGITRISPPPWPSAAFAFSHIDKNFYKITKQFCWAFDFQIFIIFSPLSRSRFQYKLKFSKKIASTSKITQHCAVWRTQNVIFFPRKLLVNFFFLLNYLI